MNDSLLQTKLYLPQANPFAVIRPALVEQLNGGLNGQLTLVAAPAGFGKTTLITNWLHHSTFPLPDNRCCWYALDEEDNDPQQFFRYLATAIQSLAIGAPPLALPQLLQRDAGLSPTLLMKAFVNDAISLGHSFLLVLDDYHLIQTAVIHKALTFLLNHQPPLLHLVISSRTDPPLPLSRLRAHRQLNELRLPQLRLSASETDAFLNGQMRLNLSPKVIQLLEARTEGWAAGLQLAALSLEKLSDPEKQTFVEALSGNNRHILDYLLDEVLRHQPPDVQQFLLKTAVLERFCAPLCQAILGTDFPHGAATEMLTQLERANLFLIPLDNERGWFRYHHLFADLLRNQLQSAQPEAEATLQQRASAWFEAQGLLTEAFAHAWRSKELDKVVALLQRQSKPLLLRGELVTLASEIGKLPTSVRRKQPKLSLFYAWATAALLDLKTAESTLDELEAFGDKLSSEEENRWLGRTAVIRGLIASKRLAYAQAMQLSEAGLRQLPADDFLLRGLAISTIGIIHWYISDTPTACGHLEAAIVANEAADNIAEAIALYGILSQSLFEMGQLRQAETVCQQALALAAKSSEAGLSVKEKRPFITLSFIYLQLGQLNREWNQLKEAERLTLRGIELAKQESLGNLLMLRLLLVLVYQNQGRTAAAVAEAKQLSKLLAELPRLGLLEQMDDFQMFYHIKSDNRPVVERWVRSRQLDPDHTPTHFEEPRYIIFALYLIWQQRWEEADRLLETVRLVVLEGGRLGRLVLVLMLAAMSQQLQGNEASAVKLMQQALDLAAPERLISVFWEGSLPVEKLLRNMLATSSQAAYIEALLAAFEVGADVARALVLPTQTAVDALTERELEVLQLVANGRSNQEIASELFLALGTVKRHLSNIYGKLGANSRTQAVARAREQQLL